MRKVELTVIPGARDELVAKAEAARVEFVITGDERAKDRGIA